MVKTKKRTWAVWENTLLALQNLRDRSFRSFLTILGVSIGVIIIMGVASVLNGFRQRFVDRVEQFGTSNIYITKFPIMSMNRWSYDIRHRKALMPEDAWAIRDQCPAVLAINAELFDEVDTVKYRDRELFMPTVRGTFPDLEQVYPIELADGRYFTLTENQQRVPVCMINWDAAETLFPHGQAVGKSIVVKNRLLKIIGVMGRLNDSSSRDEDDAQGLIYIPYNVFRQMFPSPWNESHFITARARPGQLKQALEQIEDVLRRRRHVAWTAPNDFDINTSASIVASFDRIVFATIAVMFALSTVAFMVGGVGVMNVMFASVKERTREIGVRRAIGARRRDIVWQFLVEAVVMTGVGGLFGVLVGEAMMYGFAVYLPSLPNNTPMWARIFGLFGSMSVGLLFGLWPAITAARLDPIKALRYE
ncbi:MAG: ABC transporter permease [Candidatus Sumerlaeia bacterium]